MYPLMSADLKHTYVSAGQGEGVDDGVGFRRGDEADVLAMITRVLKHFAIKVPMRQEIHFLEDALQAMPEELVDRGEVFSHLVKILTGERLRLLRRR